MNVTVTTQYVNKAYFANALNAPLGVGTSPVPTQSNSYTKTELDEGQLDNRYYTETEVNTWRNSVTQTEMGYLHGVSSDIQTQITARAVISGTPEDNQVAVWTGATDIEGTNDLVFTATGLGIGTSTPNSSLTILRAGGIASINATSDSGGHLIMDSYDADGAVRLNNYIAGDVLLAIGGGDVGINDESPSYKLDVNGTGRFTGNLYGDSNVQHLNFTTGFQGTNWQIEANGDAEFRNVLISGGLSVYELILNQLRYQDGGLIIGAGGGKVRSVDDDTLGSEVLTFEDPEGNGIIPFTVGAIVLIQDFDMDRTALIKKIVREVDAVNSDGSIDFTETAGWAKEADTGVFAAGDTIVAIGHVSDTDLDAHIYMSAVDSENPFIRIADGVDTYEKWSLGAKTAVKVQLGNLESLASYDIVPADPGYGLYCDNVFLKGKILADEGTIGGWTIDSDALYTGSKFTGNGYNTDSAGGITLSDDGSIHAPNIYVDVDGDIGLREIEHALFKADGDGIGIRIDGVRIYESLHDGAAAININYYGYDGGDTQFRTLNIGNGKETTVLAIGGNDSNTRHVTASVDKFFITAGDFVVDTDTFFVDISEEKVGINVGDTPDWALDVKGNDDAGFAASFFNDGNGTGYYGIKIQCGVDSVGAANIHPVKFYDGDGGLMANIEYDNSTISFVYISDIKLKESIKDYDIKGLGIIDRMKYRSFNWKKDKEKLEIHGWIADEVEKIYPEMVHVDPTTGYKMVAESRLIPVMMSAIKELHKKVKILELN